MYCRIGHMRLRRRGIIAGRGDMFLWGRGYNDAPDSHQPHRARMGLKLCQVSVGWRHGLALTGNPTPLIPMMVQNVKIGDEVAMLHLSIFTP